MTATKATKRAIAPAALKRYNDKRKFDVTEEPAGEASATPDGNSFVVQQHDATRMHFDFRLELDGVLLSWAVPKGPSLSPKDKRLAVQTEDHPVSYRNFEGNIPDGEYGGGPVIVWDRGIWMPIGDPHEGLKKGDLKFILNGEKLKGSFVLVRIRSKTQGPKSPWLLIKHADEFVQTGAEADITARLPQSVISGRTVKEVGAVVASKAPEPKTAKAAKAPVKVEATKSRKGASKKKSKSAAAVPNLSDIEPQLATLVDRPPASGEWVYEIKFDGYRMLAAIQNGKVQLRSRNNLDWSKTFPAIAQALSELDLGSAIVDGEVCFITPEGKSSFQGLQGALPRGGGTIPPEQQKHLAYYLFDVLFHDGLDVRAETLLERKKRLRILLESKVQAPLVYSDHFDGNGSTALNQACAAGLEGLIAKRANSPYRKGRGNDWIKLKCHKRQEFVIVGFLPAEGARQGFRSLLLAVRDGDQLRFAGKCGTGFNDQSLREIAVKLQKRIVDKSPVSNSPRMKGAVWIKPDLVAEVEFTEMTRDGSIRHPSFQGLRLDKPAKSVVREKAVPISKIEAPAAPLKRAYDLAGVRITHPDRVIDAKSGVTKGELAEYHQLVSDLLMPYAHNRPLALVRCPQGDAHKCFFQKHRLPGLGDAVKKARVADHEVLFTQSAAGILDLVQFNAIEFHGWGSTMADPMRPDWLVIDLDPDTSVPFSAVVDAALEVRDALASAGLTTFVKTTGGKGLHVVFPIQPKVDWDQAKALTRSIAEALEANAPDRYVSVMSKAKRVGKIFIDYLRNGEGATAVLPYSPRARPNATIAMPIDWKDIRKIDSQQFTVRSAKAWLSKRKRDPWAAFFTTQQMLPDFSASPTKRKRK